MTALDAIIDALWVCSGLTTCVLGIAATAHHLVGATRSGSPPESSQWAERVDPDLLIPEPLHRPGALLVIDQGRVVRVVDTTDRVAPPRECSPESR